MFDYVQRHWHGQQSLAWSFWFNLVTIRVILFVFQNAMVPEEGADYQAYRLLILVAVFVFHILLLIWQLVGVVRAAELHFLEHGIMALVWGTQLASVLLFLLTAVYAMGAVQMTLQASEDTDILAKIDAEHAQQYTLNISEDHRIVYIDGLIALGITRAFKAFLLEHSGIETVVLKSSGGNIYEGRGLARTIAENTLNTHSDALCASACIIAYSGGMVRSASKKAAFGFHQYRINADYAIIATDVVKEQRRDEKRLLDAGVSMDFVNKVYSQPSEAMWWPDLQELRVAGFLHEIVDGIE
ncbi:MAG: hypothetical protein AB8B64_06475 [Granulosicoccus sp.]